MEFIFSNFDLCYDLINGVSFYHGENERIFKSKQAPKKEKSDVSNYGSYSPCTFVDRVPEYFCQNLHRRQS